MTNSPKEFLQIKTSHFSFHLFFAFLFIAYNHRSKNFYILSKLIFPRHCSNYFTYSVLLCPQNNYVRILADMVWNTWLGTEAETKSSTAEGITARLPPGLLESWCFQWSYFLFGVPIDAWVISFHRLAFQCSRSFWVIYSFSVH